jgi:hypothetical protein
MLQAALNTEDPQYQDKRMVAQRNGKLSIQVFHVWTLRFIGLSMYCGGDGNRKAIFDNL